MPKNTPLRSIDNRTLYSGAVLTGGGGSGAGTGIPSDAAGAGLTFDGTALNVGAGDGITVAADSVGLASSLAGGGLTYMSGVLAVGAGSGITVNADDIALAASTAGAGLTYTSGVLAVGVSGLGLSVGADAITLTSSSNPGAAASILATSAAGAITLSGELQLTGTSASAQLRLRASTGGYDSYLWQNGATLQIDTESTTAAIGISTDGIVSLANRLRAPLIDTASGSLTVSPAGDLILDPGDSSVLPGGSIQDDLGDYNRKWRTLYAAELYVETLVAQDVLSTIGGRIMVAPTTTLIADVTSGATTIDVKHNNLTGAYVMLQTAPGGIAQFEIMRVTAGPTTITGGYRYTVTRNVDGSGANSWVSGDAVANLGASAGQGYIELTSTSTVHNHLGPTIAIYSRTGTGAWNDTKAVVAFGNLRSFAGYSSDEFGLAVANDLTLTETTGFRGFVADRTNGVRLYSVPLALYNGATQTVNISATGANIWVGPSSSDKRLSWDGTTLTIKGQATIKGGAAVTTSGAGLYLGSDKLGYYDGTNWLAHIDTSVGLVLPVGTSSAADTGSIRFRSGSTDKAWIKSYSSGGLDYIWYQSTSAHILRPFAYVGGSSSGSGLLVYSTDSTDPAFYVNAVSKYVGVGTASPDTTLHVVGASKFVSNGTTCTFVGTDHSYFAWWPQGVAAGRKAYFGYGAASTNNMTLMNEAAGTLILGTNNATRLTIDTSGNAYTPDSDVYARFGPVQIGYTGYSDVAGFAHRDMANTTQYAMVQNASGKTVVNSASGQTLDVRIANTDMIIVGASNTDFKKPMIFTPTSAPSYVLGKAVLYCVDEGSGYVKLKVRISNNDGLYQSEVTLASAR